MSGLKSEESTTNSLLTPFWGQFIIHDIALTPVIEKSNIYIYCFCDTNCLKVINKLKLRSCCNLISYAYFAD